MARPFAIFALAALAAAASPASAQYRPTGSVPDLSEGTLASLLRAQRAAVASCAAGEDTDAFVAEVRARVAPGRAPSTMFNARIAVTVRTRPRDHELERCVRARVRDSLRNRAYAVPRRSIRARHTFRIAERPPPREEPPAPPFSEAQVHRTLGGQRHALQRCVEIAGVPEAVTLRVAVEADGRLTLVNATLPPGTPPRSLGCLARTVSRLRVPSRPGRRIAVQHRVAVRSRAF